MECGDLVIVDGSQGEGGGQVLRSAIGIAAVSGRAVRVDRIRAGRSKPGLMRQHLTALRAAAQVCQARLTGAEPGSRSVTFEPQAVCPGDYQFSVGTAGSATLVLQTILPALLTASGPSTVVVEGGTHNQWAPPFDFLEKTWLPLINRMGPRVSAVLERHGFHPAGGGRVVVRIEPAAVLTGFDLCQRGETTDRRVRVLISNLPFSIAEREAGRLRNRLSLPDDRVTIELVASSGPGNVVLAELGFQNVTEVVTGFGRIGASAEQVAQEAVQQVRDYLSTDAPVGQCLADQWLLPLGLSAARPAAGDSQRGGEFRTLPLSRHSITHIQLLQALLPVQIDVANEPDTKTVRVAVIPRSGG